jgi:hypothetical protein
VTKSELINLLAPYGDDENLVFVTFADGITVYEQAEVAKGHSTTKAIPDGGIDMPVAIYLVDEGKPGQARLPQGAELPKELPPVDGRTADLGLLDYPFPLRPDAVVLLRNIPRDLTVPEAERIGAMLRAVAGGAGNDGAKP